MTSKAKRSLKAILFADIVGYTSLMQENELQASVMLERFRKSIQKSISNYDGQIANFYGDGALCVFDSSLDAVRCAVELQKEFTKDPEVPVRIGLHMGTVVSDGENMYGDSINIASRIESLGLAGSVLLSHRIQQELTNQPEFIFHSMGTFSFKNVRGKKEVFALGNKGLKVPQKKDLSGKVDAIRKKPIYLIIGSIAVVMIILVFLVTRLKSPVDQTAQRVQHARIAVMPFQNLSPDNKDQFYSNGIMQNIIDNLSKIPDLTVLPSRTTNLYQDTKLLPKELGEELGVEYIIDGTFQKIDSLMQVTIALTNASEGRQIWTNDKVTFSMPELFSIQAQIAGQVANQLKTGISVALNSSLKSIPTEDELAYEYYLRGNEKLRNLNHHTNTNRANAILLNEAKLLFNLAIERDTNFAAAYLGLARTEYPDYEDYKLYFMKDSIRFWRYNELVNKALNLDPELSEGYYLRGKYFLDSLNSPGEAETNWQKALNINPNNLEALYELADLYLWDNLDIIESVRLLKEIEYRTIDEEELYQIYLKLSQAYSKILDLEMEWLYLGKCIKINDTAPDLAIPWLLLRSGQQEKAVAELTKRFPNRDNQWQLVLHGVYKCQNGQFQEAIADFEKWAKLEEVQTADNWFSTNDWHRYGQALIQTGQDSLGLALIRRQLSIYKRGIENKKPNYYDIAGIYSFLNKVDSAFYYLQKEFQVGGFLKGWGNPSFILVDYQFDNIRSDERFINLFEAEKAKMRKIRKQLSSVDPDARELK